MQKVNNGAFINEKLQKGSEARKKVVSNFSGISSDELNWKAAPGSWSIGQCLEHLIISDSSYFPSFKKIAEGNYRMTRWERWSPFSGVAGRFFKEQLREDVKKKMKAPKVFLPAHSHIDTGIVDRFYQHHDIFQKYIRAFDKIDLDRPIISSPSIAIITYSLRDVVHFLTEHEHRHINQAIRAKNAILMK
jgi:hypothetical protein